jgi:hypothetical protein
MITLDEKKKILEEEILRLARRGWRVENRTDTTCMLIKEDTAMGCLSIVASLLALFPFFKNYSKTRLIEVNAEGIIKRSKQL